MRQQRELRQEKEKTPEILFAGRDEYKSHLLKQTLESDPFPSSNQNINTAVETDYDHMSVTPYEFVGDGSKTDYTKPNVGHKLHINVAPESVQQVSEYLKREQYHHKFFKGGDLADGKVFTIYIGSFQLAYKYSQEISTALSDQLCRPVDVTETEYAPNVIGRFSPHSTLGLARYGSQSNRGIPMTKEAAMQQLYALSQTDAEANFSRAYNMIANEYGPYFHG